MDFGSGQSQVIDAVFIKNYLNKMDADVAARFVLSGLSLSKIKIEDAFLLAVREMQLREEDKRKKTKKKPESFAQNSTDSVDKIDSEPFANKALTKLLEDILLGAAKKIKK